LGKIFGGIVVQFTEFFKNLGPTKRLSIIAVSAIALVTLLTMLFMASGKDYVTLFANIPNDQVTTIMAKLNEKNIPFQLREDGKTVAVPKELLHSTQMTLMSEVGSPKMGSIGLELFEKQDFGINSYAQKINYQRALQGELMRAINTLTAVKQSKVILALPNKKTFLEESGQPTASVVVELHQGKELSADQVRGIRYLVANAVEGLDADRVAVLDERGKVLSRKSDGSTGGTDELLDLKAKVEGELQERIESILSKVVGHAKVIAKVDATLNNRVVSSVEETVDPDKTAIRSQQSEE
jgi:flagellar M-ring protein FliF